MAFVGYYGYAKDFALYGPTDYMNVILIFLLAKNQNFNAEDGR